nr:Chain C, F1324 peptide [Escherichia phage T7]5H7G_D Chain D, F1324 peptide [Escherichia phage T7]
LWYTDIRMSWRVP